MAIKKGPNQPFVGGITSGAMKGQFLTQHVSGREMRRAAERRRRREAKQAAKA